MVKSILDFNYKQICSNNLKTRNNILIVDDEQFNINSMKIILEFNAKIDNIDEISDQALNGLEAVNMIKRNVDSNQGLFCNYNLILLDLNMPVMDGNTACKEIREYLY
jgi:CheY-like chemotaxis protein